MIITDNANASNYGRFYYMVGTPLSNLGRIYLHANSVHFTSDGGLVLKGNDGKTNFAFAKGQWTYCLAASVWDGHPVAVEHWDRDEDDGEGCP